MDNAHQVPSASLAKTAFVLPGGGSLGAVQVGMLHTLHEAGIHAGPAIDDFDDQLISQPSRA